MPTGDIDELMDLRETWKTEIQKAESETQLAALNEKLKILENDLAEKTQSDIDTRSKLETTLKNHDSLKDKLNAEIKVIFRFFSNLGSLFLSNYTVFHFCVTLCKLLYFFMKLDPIAYFWTHPFFLLATKSLSHHENNPLAYEFLIRSEMTYF